MKSFFKWISKRALICYIITGLVCVLAVDHERITFGLKVRILDNSMPNDFSRLLVIDRSRDIRGPFPKDKQLSKFANWYKQIAIFFPDQADAYTMFAYCLYYLGDYNQSLHSYLEAYAIEKKVFWIPYNIGVIYTQSSQHEKAVEYLTKALQTDKAYTLKYVLNSTVVYRSVLRHDAGWKQSLDARLTLGISNAYMLLIRNHYKLKNYDAMHKVAVEALTKVSTSKDVFSYYAGLALYHLKDVNSAQIYFQKSISLNTAFADLLKGKKEPPLIVQTEQFLKMF